MEALRIVFAHLFDIFKIYLKLGLITLVFYFVAEWYVLRYTDFDALVEPVAPAATTLPAKNVSMANKMFRYVLDFFIG